MADQSSRKLWSYALFANILYLNRNACVDNGDITTVQEMLQACASDYNPNNLTFKGDTVDRHALSFLGNNIEVIAASTLITPEFSEVTFVRDYTRQVVDKIDIVVDSKSYQVKTAVRGGGGDLFISSEWLQGNAQVLTVVDVENRTVYSFNRAGFKKAMATVCDIHGPFNTFRGSTGWFIDGMFIHKLCTIQSIPREVLTVSVDEDSGKFLLTSSHLELSLD